MGESVSDYLERKQRERNGSREAASVRSAGELLGLDRYRTSQQRPGTVEGSQIRNLYSAATSITETPDERSLFNFRNPFKGGLGGFASAITQPVLDLPDLPGPLNLIEQGIEEFTSPVGAAVTLASLFTGGTAGLAFAGSRFGLAGARGTIAQVASAAASELAISAGGIGASSFVNDNLPESTPGALRLIANLAAGVGVGVGTSVAIRRAAARNLTQEALDNIVNPTERGIASVYSNIPDLIEQQRILRAQFQTAQFAGREAAEQAAGARGVRGAALTAEARAGQAGAMGLVELDEDTLAAFQKVITPTAIDDIHDRMRVHQQLTMGRKSKGKNLFDINQAERGLEKLFAVTAEVPTEGEWKHLSQFLDPSMQRAIQQSAKSSGRQALDFMFDAANIPRAVAASMDMSAVMRQGIFLIGHPVTFAKSFGRMMNAVADPEYAAGRITSLKQSLAGTGVEITDFRRGMGPHEEVFASAVVHDFPIWGKLSRASERAYTMFLNELRGGVYKETATNWAKTGAPSKLGFGAKTAVQSIDLDDLARFVNYATGRSDASILRGDLGRMASATFFSPQFFASRLQAPAMLFTADGAVQTEVARNMGAMLATGAGILTLLKWRGAEISLDPRSSDFGKGKIDNTRFDFWGGYQQIARYATQFVMGEGVSTGSKREFDIRRDEVLWNFVHSKFAPTTGLAADILSGETFLGEELQPDIDTFSEQMFARTAPLFMQDVVDAFRNSGNMTALGASSAAFFGVGATSFTSTAALRAKYGLDVASPRTKLKILADNPEVAEELIRRNELAAARGSDAAERTMAAEVFHSEFEDKQLATDSLMLTGKMTPGQWRDQYKLLGAEKRGTFEALFRDVEDDPSNLLTQYGDAIQNATDSSGQVEWEAVDLWLISQPATTQSYIADNTGLRDTELRKAYKADLTRLDDAKFFDIRDEVWHQATQLSPDLASFASLDDWVINARAELKPQVIAQGMDPLVADQEVERILRNHPVMKFIADSTNSVQQRWITRNPELAAIAASWELLNLQIAERQFISQALQ